MPMHNSIHSLLRIVKSNFKAIQETVRRLWVHEATVLWLFAEDLRNSSHPSFQFYDDSTSLIVLGEMEDPYNFMV